MRKHQNSEGLEEARKNSRKSKLLTLILNQHNFLKYWNTTYVFTMFLIQAKKWRLRTTVFKIPFYTYFKPPNYSPPIKPSASKSTSPRACAPHSSRGSPSAAQGRFNTSRAPPATPALSFAVPSLPATTCGLRSCWICSNLERFPHTCIVYIHLQQRYNTIEALHLHVSDSACSC